MWCPSVSNIQCQSPSAIKWTCESKPPGHPIPNKSCSKMAVPSAFTLHYSDLNIPRYLVFVNASQGTISYTDRLCLQTKPARKELTISHALYRASSKQGRVLLSSTRVKRLAKVTLANEGSPMAKLQRLESNSQFSSCFLLITKFTGRFSSITILHEKGSYRLTLTAFRIRNSIKNKELSIVQWVPRKCDIADVSIEKKSFLM